MLSTQRNVINMPIPLMQFLYIVHMHWNLTLDPRNTCIYCKSIENKNTILEKGNSVFTERVHTCEGGECSHLYVHAKAKCLPLPASTLLPQGHSSNLRLLLLARLFSSSSILLLKLCRGRGHRAVEHLWRLELVLFIWWFILQPKRVVDLQCSQHIHPRKTW